MMNIYPGAPIHTWSGYDIAINTMLDDGVGFNDIQLVYRVSGAANPWISMGATDGTIYQTQNWSEDVMKAGNFASWWLSILGLINARLASWAAAIHPVPPPALPVTFAEFQAWLPSNIQWHDQPTSITVS